MSKDEYIAYWKETADTDWDTALYLFDGAKNPHGIIYVSSGACKVIESTLG